MMHNSYLIFSLVNSRVVTIKQNLGLTLLGLEKKTMKILQILLHQAIAFVTTTGIRATSTSTTTNDDNSINHVGSSITFDLSLDISSNPQIDFDQSLNVDNSDAGGGGAGVVGVVNTIDPSNYETYERNGLVALYSFNEVDNGDGTWNNSTGNSNDQDDDEPHSIVILRGLSPCGLPTINGDDNTPSSSSCPPAVIVGNANATDPPPLQIPDNDSVLSPSHESCLFVPSGIRNWAQIHPGPYLRNQPLYGMTTAAWIKPDLSSSSSQSNFGDGYVWERQYGNFDLQSRSNGNCYRCRIRDAAAVHYNSDWYCYGNDDERRYDWTHVTCTFQNDHNQLILYINGTSVSQVDDVTLPNDELYSGDGSPFGIGNRPAAIEDVENEDWGANADSNHFMGYIDDLAFWNQPLDDDEVNRLYLAQSALTPAPLIVMTLVNVVKVDDETPFSREFSAVTIDWTTTTTSSSSAKTTTEDEDEEDDDDSPAVLVEISTDNGKFWCAVINGVPVTDLFHGNDNNGNCLFPSVSLKIRVWWQKNVELTSLQASFHPDSPYDDDDEHSFTIPIGMNLDRVSQYSSHWAYTDLFRYSGGARWPYVRSGIDENGWPLEIDPELDDADGVTHVVGRNVMMSSNNGTYPGGTYTLYAEGSGTIILSGDDAGYHSLTLPLPSNRYEFDVTPSNSGIVLEMRESVLGNHIRNVKVMMPGFDVDGDDSIFHPTYLDSLSSFHVIRFMNYGNTNNQNVARWEDRNTPDSVSQDYPLTRRISIQDVELVEDGTLFLGDWLVLFTTVENHGLVSGQFVSIIGSDAIVTVIVNNLGEEIEVSLDMDDRMIEVLTSTTFLLSYSSRNWTSEYETTGLSVGDDNGNGVVEIRNDPGVSLEHQIDLANTLDANGWFNIPHLATDDYIRQMAILIRDNLNGELKAYIEYSNEVWNINFIQTYFAGRMALNETIEDSYPHLRWYGRKCKSVFAIFDEVFGSSARQRLVRVVAVQRGSGDLQLSEAGGEGAADALAIAPYFGGRLNSELAETWDVTTVDEVLNVARDRIIADTLRSTQQAFDVAQAYGVELITYEGGQHMGGPGRCGSFRCENIVGLQDLFIAANRNPRMKGLYKNMLRAWHMGGGGTFVAYSHIRFNYRYGSWGSKEYQLDPNDWKFQALSEYAEGTESSPSLSPSLSLIPTTSQNPTLSPTSNTPTLSPTPISTELDLSDEFDDPSTLSQWDNVNPQFISEMSISNGKLSITPSVSNSYVWYEDNEGIFLSKNVHGNVLAEISLEVTPTPNGQWHAGGILLRSETDEEDWVVINIGDQGQWPADGLPRTLGSEHKSTTDGSSEFRYRSGEMSGRLRICRVGNDITLLRYLSNDDNWTAETYNDDSAGPFDRSDIGDDVKVGIIVNRFGASSTEFTVEVDYIRFAIPGTQSDCFDDDIFTTNPTSSPSNIPSNIPSSVPSDNPSDLPSNLPSYIPSNIPSGVPSDNPSDVPSDIPSNIPSNIPSSVPSDNPSNEIPSGVPSDDPSDIPSHIPSNIPSSVPSDNPSDIPSHIPSNIPSYIPSTSSCKDSTRKFYIDENTQKEAIRDCKWVARTKKKWKCKKEDGAVATHCPKTCERCNICEDSAVRFKMQNNGKFRKCAWINAKNSDKRCAQIGDFYTCRETCGACIPPTPAPTSTCKDSSRDIMIKGIRRNCEWVAKWETEKRCAKNNGTVATHCPKTCGTCNGGCVDSECRFEMKHNGKFKTCAWVNDKKRVKRCSQIGDLTTCRKTCGLCPES